MAQIVDTIERDGRKINVYDNGMQRDADTGHFMRPPDAVKITKANSKEMHQKRQEKARRLLRQRIKESTAAKSTLPINDSAEAFAEAGGILWDEIVLAGPMDGVYPRDRLEAYFKLGAASGVIPNASERQGEEKNNVAPALAAVATELLAVLRDAIQPRDVVAGTVIEPAQLADGEAD